MRWLMNDGARERHPLLESFRQPRRAVPASVGDLEQREGIVDGLVRIGKPVEPRVDGHVLANREVVPQARRFREKADALRAIRAPRRASSPSPSICTEPDVGAMSPASMRSVVVLPAPLGPSKAKISPAVQFERHIVDRHAVCRSGASGAVRSARAWP